MYCHDKEKAGDSMKTVNLFVLSKTGDGRSLIMTNNNNNVQMKNNLRKH